MPAWTRDAIAAMLDRLEDAYGQTPYRPRFDPMEELISCILSQHTSDTNSFPAFTRLRERFPDWGEMERAGAESVADCIRAAGLANQKARAIVGCLAEIRRRNSDYTLGPLRQLCDAAADRWLLSLPGVGPKTSAIVRCFAFGRPAIPVDTHVYRTSRRLGLLGPKVDEVLAHRVLRQKVRAADAFRFHTLLIQHGRNVCRAPKPRCAQCNVQDRCRTFGKLAVE